MNRKWQQVTPTERLGRWRVPQATMNRRGDIKLSRVAWELLERAPYAFVFYDNTNRTIGIRPCNSHVKDTFALKTSGLHGARVINVAVLNYEFRVSFKKTIRFHDIRLDEDGTLLLDLTQATEAYHGRRIGAFHNERTEKLDRKHAVVPHYIRDL